MFEVFLNLNFLVVARIISGIKKCVFPQHFIEISKGKSPFKGFPFSLKLKLVYLNYILDPKHLYHLAQCHHPIFPCHPLHHTSRFY